MPDPMPAPRQPLCPSSELEEAGRAHVWDVLEHGRPARAFVLRFEGQLRGYINRCLHVPVEMDWQPGEFLDRERRYIVCSIHGATYQPEDGRCVGSPCGGGRLKPVAVGEADGWVHWYPSPDLRPAFDDDAEAGRQPPSPSAAP